jgi:hypothetical protein
MATTAGWEPVAMVSGLRTSSFAIIVPRIFQRVLGGIEADQVILWCIILVLNKAQLAW